MVMRIWSVKTEWADIGQVPEGMDAEQAYEFLTGLFSVDDNAFIHIDKNSLDDYVKNSMPQDEKAASILTSIQKYMEKENKDFILVEIA